jgi:hypothetical protein
VPNGTVAERSVNFDFYYKRGGFMKKALCFLSVVMMSLVMVGCGNSPNGDKQKLEAPSSWVN